MSDTTQGATTAAGADTPRDQAIARLKAKREFTANLVSFLIVNACFWALWAMTGAGYPWPIWITGPWLVGVAIHAWQLRGERPITEADIEREMRRQGGA